MNNRKMTKRSLVTAVIALVLCMGMLVGTTFAWFTDSVTSGRNQIVAGNLDIVLEYKTPTSTEWKEVTADTVLFSEDSLWEPGHTEAVALRIRNVGTLALKYEIATTVYEEKAGTNVAGEAFKLSDYLTVGHSAVQQDGQIGDMLMDIIMGSRKQAAKLANTAFGEFFANPNPAIMPGEAHVCALAITMPETVGNEANYKTGTDAPSISFGITLAATQYTYESDSFGNDYDKDADILPFVSNVKDLRAALAAGESVALTNDLDVEADVTAPYGNKMAFEHNGGVFDGNGHTLNVDVYGDDYGIMTSGGTIKNVTITGAARGIVLMSATEDVILDNVHISDDTLYPLNTAEHATVDGVDLIVSNSTFGGWTSFAGLETASFTDCDFISGNYGYGWPYDCLVKPFVNTTFTGCDFVEGFYIDLSALEAGCKVVLDGCTVDGQALTESMIGFNCDGSETVCVELPAGRTFADCVIIK